MLTLEGVRAGYGRQIVIRDVSQDIDMRGATALVGPNGHGKSTLMAAISGLRPLVSGRISIGGRDMSARPPQARLDHGLVHVPQGDRLFPEMSVEENLLLGGTVLKGSAAVSETLEWVYSLMPVVSDRRHRQARALSGGERRMAAIARGLMTRCKFVMLDEPSLGLAPIAADEVYGIIRRLHGDGYGFLIVEENMDRVLDVAERFVLIENGGIGWSGSASELNAGVLRKWMEGDNVPVQ